MIVLFCTVPLNQFVCGMVSEIIIIIIIITMGKHFLLDRKNDAQNI